MGPLVMQALEYNYRFYVEQYMDTFIKVKLNHDDLLRADKFVKEKITAKATESHHIVDGSQEYKRSYTGALGEMAVNKFLGFDFVDLTVGPSSNYSVPDLGSCGIKSVEWGKYPLILKVSRYPEIIVLKHNDDTLYICGIATPLILNTFQSLDCVLSPNVIRRGEKTGFYGFDKLISPIKIKYVLESSITGR